MFDVAKYPGSDNEPASAHGHFVTVRAEALPPSTIFLPTVVNGVFTFDVPDVGPNIITFIDPAVAIGYDYMIGAGDPSFASVLLPDVGDGQFLLGYLSGGQFVQTALTHDVLFSFPQGGAVPFVWPVSRPRQA